jgi:hypothetical protein
MKEGKYIRLLRGAKFYCVVTSYTLQEEEHEPDLTAISSLCKILLYVNQISLFSYVYWTVHHLDS